MSDNDGAFGFGRFVPGFDFLQNLAKSGSRDMPQMPSLGNWVAPTLNVEELDKRIGELRAVQFWLEQNGKALAATIQALEVQKMTLATLQGMNFKMGEVAEALKVKTPDPLAAAQKMAGAAHAPAAAGANPVRSTRRKPGAAKAAGESAAAPVDPLQWWGALTQQFQEIASHAMKDVAQAGATDGAAAAAKSPAPPRKAAPRKKPAAGKRTRT